MKWPREILEKLEKLKKKYVSTGQDMSSYLEGFVHMDYPKYWDYVQLNVLLNLQNPKTKMPDEEIFIVYHQITELWFKLTIKALRNITQSNEPTVELFLKYIGRANMYLKNCIDSFPVMVEGLEKEEFLKFRMALLPASGFQSAQYRIIEMIATTPFNLVEHDMRRNFLATDNEDKLYEHFYWKKGGIELATGYKTLTLQHFEEKYGEMFIQELVRHRRKDVYSRFNQLMPAEQKHEELKKQMRLFDLNMEVLWPLAHYRSAVKHLHRDPEYIAATGGTNWQKYLPPKFQRIILFPKLWTAIEQGKWGVENDK